MKKSVSKSFTAIIISAVIFQLPLLAQVKTTFTKNEEYLVCNSNYGTTFIYPNGIV